MGVPVVPLSLGQVVYTRASVTKQYNECRFTGNDAL